MKLEKIKNGDECKITFIPETEEEKLIMGNFRNHYFFGLESQPYQNTGLTLQVRKLTVACDK